MEWLLNDKEFIVSVFVDSVGEPVIRKYQDLLNDCGVKATPVGVSDETEESPEPVSEKPDAPPREIPFEFHGDGQQYFKIWIVNLVLSILTLGIYSAWAKVRRKQYFYGNTKLDGVSFQYTAPAGECFPDSGIKNISTAGWPRPF